MMQYWIMTPTEMIANTKLGAVLRCLHAVNGILSVKSFFLLSSFIICFEYIQELSS